MKVIYMGRKPAASKALKHLIGKGIDVVVVVAPPKCQKVYWDNRLIDVAESYGIPTATDDDLYNYINGEDETGFEFDLEDIDLVISFLFWKRIKKPLIELPKIGCINFHSAPLPDFRGFAPYSFAIYENISYWGVSAHFVDETFDTGDVVKTYKYDIDLSEETAFSLEQKSMNLLLELFDEVIDEALEKGSLHGTPQEKGGYKTKKDFEKLRKIQPEDTLEDIERKIRAFWYPPFIGASIELNNIEYTLVSEKILKQIGERYHK